MAFKSATEDGQDTHLTDAGAVPTASIQTGSM